MIKHIVVWRLKDSALGADKTENLARAKSAIEALRDAVPSVRHLEVGLDIGASPDSWDIVIYSEFDDRAGLDAYQVHPEHMEVAALIGELRELRAAIDYEGLPVTPAFAPARSRSGRAWPLGGSPAA